MGERTLVVTAHPKGEPNKSVTKTYYYARPRGGSAGSSRNWGRQRIQEAKDRDAALGISTQNINPRNLRRGYVYYKGTLMIRREAERRGTEALRQKQNQQAKAEEMKKEGYGGAAILLGQLKEQAAAGKTLTRKDIEQQARVLTPKSDIEKYGTFISEFQKPIGVRRTRAGQSLYKVQERSPTLVEISAADKKSLPVSVDPGIRYGMSIRADKPEYVTAYEPVQTYRPKPKEQKITIDRKMAFGIGKRISEQESLQREQSARKAKEKVFGEFRPKMYNWLRNIEDKSAPPKFSGNEARVNPYKGGDGRLSQALEFVTPSSPAELALDVTLGIAGGSILKGGQQILRGAKKGYKAWQGSISTADDLMLFNPKKIPKLDFKIINKPSSDIHLTIKGIGKEGKVMRRGKRRILTKAELRKPPSQRFKGKGRSAYMVERTEQGITKRIFVEPKRLPKQAGSYVVETQLKGGSVSREVKDITIRGRKLGLSESSLKINPGKSIEQFGQPISRKQTPIGNVRQLNDKMTGAKIIRFKEGQSGRVSYATIARKDRHVTSMINKVFDPDIKLGGKTVKVRPYRQNIGGYEPSLPRKMTKPFKIIESSDTGMRFIDELEFFKARYIRESIYKTPKPKGSLFDYFYHKVNLSGLPQKDVNKWFVGSPEEYVPKNVPGLRRPMGGYRKGMKEKLYGSLYKQQEELYAKRQLDALKEAAIARKNREVMIFNFEPVTLTKYQSDIFGTRKLASKSAFNIDSRLGLASALGLNTAIFSAVDQNIKQQSIQKQVQKQSVRQTELFKVKNIFKQEYKNDYFTQKLRKRTRTKPKKDYERLLYGMPKRPPAKKEKRIPLEVPGRRRKIKLDFPDFKNVNKLYKSGFGVAYTERMYKLGNLRL